MDVGGGGGGFDAANTVDGTGVLNVNVGTSGFSMTTYDPEDAAGGVILAFAQTLAETSSGGFLVSLSMAGSYV